MGGSGVTAILPPSPILQAYRTSLGWDEEVLRRALNDLIGEGRVVCVQRQASNGEMRGYIRFTDAPLCRIPGFPPEAMGVQMGNADNSDRPVYCMSAFDGGGTCRFTIGGAMHRLGQAHQFQGAVSVEIDDALARRVDAYWGSSDRTTYPDLGPPQRRLASDVWDLFDTDNSPQGAWTTFLEGIPDGALLLIVGGFPCIDLTKIGALKGALGVVGLRSHLIFSMALMYWIAKTKRPGIHVAMIVENVSPMLDVHKDAIKEIMGDIPSDHAPVLDASRWTVAPRKRIWFATFPPANAEDEMQFTRLPLPWDPGWAPLPGGQTPTWTRQRPGPLGGPSRYQTHPKHILGHRDAGSRWFLGSPDDVERRISTLLAQHRADDRDPGAT